MQKLNILSYKQNIRKINGHPLMDNITTSKILGVAFHINLKFTLHTNTRKTLATVTMNKLRRFRGLQPRLFIELFNTLIILQ